MVVMEGLFAIDDASNVPKLLDMTRDCYGSFLIETVLFFSFLEEVHEEGKTSENSQGCEAVMASIKHGYLRELGTLVMADTQHNTTQQMTEKRIPNTKT
ncbi:hypothetical protein CR513_40145, partial [Mucuna pruriens]